jgi:hypothetical protein
MGGRRSEIRKRG